MLTSASSCKSKQFSLCLISAISLEGAVAAQVLEGAVDSIIFENFIFSLCKDLRKQERTREREIVVFLDNARAHCHS